MKREKSMQQRYEKFLSENEFFENLVHDVLNDYCRIKSNGNIESCGIIESISFTEIDNFIRVTTWDWDEHVYYDLPTYCLYDSNWKGTLLDEIKEKAEKERKERLKREEEYKIRQDKRKEEQDLIEYKRLKEKYEEKNE